MDGFYLENRSFRASFGTTKYCNTFLRHMPCSNPDCLYLHEMGDDDDSFTKEQVWDIYDKIREMKRNRVVNYVTYQRINIMCICLLTYIL